MLTIIILLAVAALVTFFLVKKGKIKDANNNNIPDVIEEKVKEVKQAVNNTKKAKKKPATK
jgi:flagellar basal body-associated protein FliL